MPGANKLQHNSSDTDYIDQFARFICAILGVIRNPGKYETYKCVHFSMERENLGSGSAVITILGDVQRRGNYLEIKE